MDRLLSYAGNLLEAGELDRSHELAGEALHVATLCDDRIGIAQAHHAIGRALLRRGRFADALAPLRKAARELEEIEEPEAAQAAACDLAGALAGAGDRFGAIEQYEKVHRIATDVGDLAGAAESLEAMAELQGSLGDGSRALASHLSALALREQLGDDDQIALAYSNVGAVHGQLGDYRKALECFDKAIEAARRGANRLMEVRTLVNASRAHYSLGELDPALEIATKALEIYNELEDASAIRGVLSDIGCIHERRGELDVALEYNLKAVDYLQGRDPDTQQVQLFLNVVNLYNRMGLFADAAGVGAQALGLACCLGEPALEYQLHHALATAYEGIDDARRALSHFRSYAELRETVQSVEMRRSIAELQLHFDVERTAREREIYRLKAERLEVENEHKASELTAMALNLVQKNELLERLTGQLKELGRRPTDDMRRQARSLLNQVSEGRAADDGWKAFEQQLDQLHGDFVDRLAQRHPSLSQTEIRVCSLVKLGLSSKQIAGLLGTVERTVENHRYRIRNKIEPDGETRLATLLAALQEDHRDPH